MAELPTAQQAAELDHRRRPRRRGAQLLAAVFDAVLAELSERGYGALTVDAVAQRARVSKASLYRRWPSKRDLVLAAVQAVLPADREDLADTGTLRDDLVAYFAQVAAHLNGPAGPAMRGILGDVLGDPVSAAELYSAAQRRRSTAQLHSVLSRAASRGELPEHRLATVTARQLEAGPAILRHHYLWEGHVSHQLCIEIVDEVVLPLLGLPAPAQPAPAHASADHPPTHANR
jgi:AcrR family transcriptional regulator